MVSVKKLKWRPYFLWYSSSHELSKTHHSSFQNRIFDSYLVFVLQGIDVVESRFSHADDFWASVKMYFHVFHVCEACFLSPGKSYIKPTSLVVTRKKNRRVKRYYKETKSAVKTASESTEKFVVTVVNRNKYCVTSCATRDLPCYFVLVTNFKFVWKNHIKTQLNQINPAFFIPTWSGRCMLDIWTL